MFLGRLGAREKVVGSQSGLQNPACVQLVLQAMIRGGGTYIRKTREMAY